MFDGVLRVEVNGTLKITIFRLMGSIRKSIYKKGVDILYDLRTHIIILTEYEKKHYYIALCSIGVSKMYLTIMECSQDHFCRLPALCQKKYFFVRKRALTLILTIF